MKLTPEVEKHLEELKTCLVALGTMSKAGVEYDDVFTSLGTLNASKTGLLLLARLKRALQEAP